MTTDDVVHDGQHVVLRLGDPPTPAPEPVAALLLDYLQALPASTPAIQQDPPGSFLAAAPRIATEAGAPWKKYAPGDHPR
ncbi:hypothetical protein ABZ743_09210 [Streptomyces sp. NPDC006662]|uniref:hypothetical protein n=1 Tax=Streptomyces sp. NPDC006662 TaxID=3156902 RepID=UPI0033D33160